jgi:hypothetical protein
LVVARWHAANDEVSKVGERRNIAVGLPIIVTRQREVETSLVSSSKALCRTSEIDAVVDKNVLAVIRGIGAWNLIST